MPSVFHGFFDRQNYERHVIMERNNYVVYCHTSPNGKKYIGITRQEPGKRWNNGKGYSYNRHFHRAIQKFGWDNIKHDLLYDQLTQKEAAELEKLMIAKYQTTNPDFGYNMTSGGEVGYQLTSDCKTKLSEAHIKINKDGRNKKRNIGGNNARAKTIYQYTKDDVFLCEYRSVSDAARVLAFSGIAKNAETARQSIMKAANHRLVNVRGYKAITRSAYGYQWKYEKDSDLNGCVLIKKRKRRTRPVLKYSLTGKLIKKYATIKEAADELGVKEAHISQCASGSRISAHGYMWIYADTENIEKVIKEKVSKKMLASWMYSKENHRAKSVEQYDFDGNYIQTFATIADASRTLDISPSEISACARGKKHNKSAGGFIWVYADDNNKNNILDKAMNKGCEKAVNQYTLNGEYIKTFTSIAEIKKSLGSSAHISDVCCGKRNNALGYTWKYA